MICVCFQGKPFNITVIQIYAPTLIEHKEVEWLYEDLGDFLELTAKKKKKRKKKKCPFHHKGLE